MPPVTRRTTAARTASAKPASSGYRGEEGMRRMQEEEQRQAARREQAKLSAGMPFRFFTVPGEEREIVIVDDRPDFFRYEHNMQDRFGKWRVFHACIAENANCPLCKELERPAYFAMYLTCIDLTPYENKDGDTIEWSKKLLVVKPQQQKKFTRLLEREGTLRGAILRMARDGEKDSAIGNDIEFLGFMDEEELLAYEAEYEYEKDGKTVTKEIIGHEPFDYDELFPAPTEKALRALVGGRPEPGSRDEQESAGVRRTRTREGDGWDDDQGQRGAGATTRTASRTVTRTSRRAEPEGSSEGDDAAVDDQPPARTATRARPTVRTTSRRTAEPDEAPEDPPQRAARTTLRRPARPDPEAEPAEPAERTTASLAERRRALRRG